MSQRIQQPSLPEVIETPLDRLSAAAGLLRVMAAGRDDERELLALTRVARKIDGLANDLQRLAGILAPASLSGE
jgi:hypothetical protein